MAKGRPLQVAAASPWKCPEEVEVASDMAVKAGKQSQAAPAPLSAYRAEGPSGGTMCSLVESNNHCVRQVLFSLPFHCQSLSVLVGKERR